MRADRVALKTSTQSTFFKGATFKQCQGAYFCMDPTVLGCSGKRHAELRKPWLDEITYTLLFAAPTLKYTVYNIHVSLNQWSRKQPFVGLFGQPARNLHLECMLSNQANCHWACLRLPNTYCHYIDIYWLHCKCERYFRKCLKQSGHASTKTKCRNQLKVEAADFLSFIAALVQMFQSRVVLLRRVSCILTRLAG